MNNHVLVTGTPGAWINHISRRLYQFGWAVLWPGQDIDTKFVRLYFEHDYQNFEAQRIHQSICDQYGINCLSDNLPVYYEPPFPGPSEFIAKFDSPAVISSSTMAPFLDLWAGVTNVVVDVQATESEDEKLVSTWLSRGSNILTPPEYIKSICNCYRSRYNNHLKLFNKVFTITNEEVKNKQFDGLDKFLALL